jgi:hypothetical protein
MPASNPMSQQQKPLLMAARVFDKGWAVVSSSRTALTESEANRIIAAYTAVNELFNSTV